MCIIRTHLRVYGLSEIKDEELKQTVNNFYREKLNLENISTGNCYQTEINYLDH